MMQSESIANLAAALVAAQSDIKPVEKTAVNPHFRSKFAPLDALIGMARPALRKHGITVLQSGGAFEDGKGLNVETRLIHSSGEWISGVVYIPFGKADPQGSGAALSYGRRFGLSAMLSIAAEDDDDGESASAPRPAATQTRSGSAVAEKLMPFGKTKGKKLGDLTDAELKNAIEWCKKTDAKKFEDLIGSMAEVLADRGLPEKLYDELLQEDSKDLPFD